MQSSQGAGGEVLQQGAGHSDITGSVSGRACRVREEGDVPCFVSIPGSVTNHPAISEVKRNKVHHCMPVQLT